jgi:hypothetical protein
MAHAPGVYATASYLLCRNGPGTLLIYGWLIPVASAEGKTAKKYSRAMVVIDDG